MTFHRSRNRTRPNNRRARACRTIKSELSSVDLGGDDDLGVEASAPRIAPRRKVRPQRSEPRSSNRSKPKDNLPVPRVARNLKRAVKAQKSAKHRASQKKTKTPETPIFRKLVLKAEQIVSLPNGGNIEIGGIQSADKTRFTWLRDGLHMAVLPYSAWHAGGAEASRGLVDQGVPVVGGMKEIRSAVAQLSSFPRTPIATKPGWSKDGFTLANGRTIIPHGRRLPLLAFKRSKEMLRQGGSLKGWKRAVAKPLADHLLATFFMLTPFAAPLLGLTNRADNFGFEIVGSAGRGKSTLQYLIASAAGPAFGNGGSTYWRTCNTTLAALETVMGEHADMVLILDEAGLVPGAGREDKRAEEMRAMAFNLANGRVRHRFGQKVGHMTKLIYVISTNRSVVSTLGTAYAAETEAIADRLMSIGLRDDRPFGIFDACPPEYGSTGALADALKTAAGRHFGHAVPAFVQWLVQQRAEHPKRLRHTINRLIGRFVAQSGANTSDGSERRVAEAFGLVYAAGVLAKKAKVLPKNYRCMKAARVCHDLHRNYGRALRSFDDRLRTLMRHPELIDMDAVDPADLTQARIAACPVFLFTGRSGARELLVPYIHRQQAFHDWNTIRHGVEVERRLKPGKERNVDRKPIGFRGSRMTVYVFDVTDLVN